MPSQRMKSIVVGLWPYADDPKYEKRIDMLERQVRDSIMAGVTQEQVDAAFEGAANECGTVMKWFQVATNKLGELKWAERRRFDGPSKRYGNPHRETDHAASMPIPWRVAGKTFKQWVNSDRDNAKRVLRKCLPKDQSDEMSRTIDADGLHDESFASAVMQVIRSIKRPGGNVFD